MSVTSPWPDPIDLRTSLVLADYKWLPARYHDAFQTLLERNEGLSRVFFAAEVQLAAPAVLLLSSDAVHVMRPNATPMRRVALPNVKGIGVARGEWLRLRAAPPNTAGEIGPSEEKESILFRLTAENESPLASVRVLLTVLSALLGMCRPASRVTRAGVGAVGFYDKFDLVRSMPCDAPSEECTLELLRYDSIWKDVASPQRLIEHMQLHHQLLCGPSPPIPSGGPQTQRITPNFSLSFTVNESPVRTVVQGGLVDSQRVQRRRGTNNDEDGFDHSNSYSHDQRYNDSATTGVMWSPIMERFLLSHVSESADTQYARNIAKELLPTDTEDRRERGISPGCTHAKEEEEEGRASLELEGENRALHPHAAFVFCPPMHM